MPVKVKPGTARIIRGASEVLALGFKRKRSRDRVSQIGGLIGDTLEDGLSFEFVTDGNRLGFALRRQAKEDDDA